MPALWISDRENRIRPAGWLSPFRDHMLLAMNLSDCLDGLRTRFAEGPAPIVPVVRLDGAIGMRTGLQTGLSLATVETWLARAFAIARAPAVAIAVNSPGGSPVQSALIAGRIRALAEENGKPVFVFVEDIAASGGYWLACAGDEIWADEASIVGSIGVIAAGFGFQDLIGRLGVERRVHAVGDRKGALDPFRPEDPKDVARLDAVLASTHESFKNMVRTRRTGRLRGDEATLFSGDFWVGREAMGLGLIDGIGHMRDVLRDRFGERLRLMPVGGRPPFWRRFVRSDAHVSAEGLALAAGAVVDRVAGSLEERALWARYGL